MLASASTSSSPTTYIPSLPRFRLLTPRRLGQERLSRKGQTGPARGSHSRNIPVIRASVALDLPASVVKGIATTAQMRDTVIYRAALGIIALVLLGIDLLSTGADARARSLHLRRGPHALRALRRCPRFRPARRLGGRPDQGAPRPQSRPRPGGGRGGGARLRQPGWGGQPQRRPHGGAPR